MKPTWASLLLSVPLAIALTVGTGAIREQPEARATELCNGRFDGTWNFRGGRPMSLELAGADGFDHAQVTLRYLGLELPMEATCVVDLDRGAELSFNGPDENGLVHSGALYVAPEGHISGAIDGYAFRN